MSSRAILSGTSKIQEVSALTALARTLAANLEKARFQDQRDRLLAADREMARATQLNEMTQAILACARDLTGAVSTRLSLNGDTCIPWTKAGSSRSEAAAQAGSVIFLRRKLISSHRLEVGWVEVAKPMPGSFSREDEIALADLAAQAADALDAAREREARDRVRVDRLRQLADSVLGGGDLNELLDRVVAATADALDVGGASLYLLDEAKEKLVIQAAAGQEAVLLEAHAEYAIGEGITGGIALEGKTVVADSETALHLKPHWQGKYIGSDHSEPKTFLGLPLTVFDRVAGGTRVIGVLKLVDKRTHAFRSPVFDDEDVHLGEMIANVLATIVYHHHASQVRFEKLSRDLSALSAVLAGGREMHDLLNPIVETMMQAVGAEAAALFLVDEASNRVVVQAAAGYQANLLKERASYGMGEGVTGWIARRASHSGQAQCRVASPSCLARPVRLPSGHRTELLLGPAPARDGSLQRQGEGARRPQRLKTSSSLRSIRSRTSPIRTSCW